MLSCFLFFLLFFKGLEFLTLMRNLKIVRSSNLQYGIFLVCSFAGKRQLAETATKWVCLKIVYPYTQGFCWWLSLLNGYNWGYTPFSDIPKWRNSHASGVVFFGSSWTGIHNLPWIFRHAPLAKMSTLQGGEVLQEHQKSKAQMFKLQTWHTDLTQPQHATAKAWNEAAEVPEGNTTCYDRETIFN